MPKVYLWESGRERIYVPVVCYRCEEQVSISGKVQEGQIVCDPCPKCGAAFDISVDVETDTDASDSGVAVSDSLNLTTSAEVKWFCDGWLKESAFKFPECPSVVETILRVLRTGCMVYSCEKVSPMHLVDIVLRTQISALYSPEGLNNLKTFIDEVISKKTGAGNDQK
jgi:hypothetical protein